MKNPPRKKNNRPQSRNVQESTRRQPANHSASQSATQPAAPASPAGQPTSQPARTRSTQAQVQGPKWTLSVSGVKPHSVAPDSVSCKSQQTPQTPSVHPGKQKEYGPKAELSRRAQGASQPAIQPASQPRTKQLWSADLPALQPGRNRSR